MQFDYIVIGGGSAGAVLASRLSESGTKQVGLFEAGPDTPPGFVPDIISDTYPAHAYFDRRYHWTELKAYTRSPTLNSERPRLSKFEQARVMGGGSSINGQFAVRGLPHDYDEWEKLGLAGWGWRGMLPYLKKLERDLDFDDELHNTSGNIPIRRIFPQDWAIFTKTVLGVVKDSYPYRADFNGDFDDGSFPIPMSNENNQRVSTAVGYLTREVRARANLHIFSDTLVHDLILKDDRVIGIEASIGGETKSAFAREVIVSAGALHSPAFLLRAGIGPANQLAKLGIPVVSNLPGVGENLTDHPHLSVGAHLKKPARLPPTQRRHVFMGIRYSSDFPDCCPSDMLIMPTNRSGGHPLGKSLGTLNVLVNKSYSRGTVRLRSPHHQEEPIVDLNLASDHRDLMRLADGFKRIYQIIVRPELEKVVNTWFLAGYNDEVRRVSARTPSNWLKMGLAACAFDYVPFFRDVLLRKKFGTMERIHRMMQDEDLIVDWVKESVWSGWHVSGTCKMGAKDDPMAVVDAECRVRGVQGLRVVDASIMPTIVTANTNITTIAMAEKASDLILAKAC